MEKKQKSTVEIANEIDQATSWDELQKILTENEVGKRTFGDFLSTLCEKYHVKMSHLQMATPISKSLFYAVLNDTKKASKETVLLLGINLEVSIEELNELLKLAGHKELYPKNIDDAIILFGLKNNRSIYEIDEELKRRGSKLTLIDKE